MKWDFKNVEKIMLEYVKDNETLKKELPHVIREQIEINSNKVKHKDGYNKLKNKIKRTKKRWYDIEIKDSGKSNYYDVLRNIENLIKLRKIDLKAFDCSDFKEFEEKELKKIREWYKSEERLLVSFPYFNSKNLKSQRVAMKNDIDFLLHKGTERKNRKSTPFPLTPSKLPFSSGNKSVFPITENEDNTKYEQEILNNDYITVVTIDKDSVIKNNNKLFMTSDIQKEKDIMNKVYSTTKGKSEIANVNRRGMMLETIKILGDLDRNVLFQVIRRVDDNSDEFVNRGMVRFKLNSVVKDIYAVDSSKNAKAVRLSLKKMKEMNISKYNENIRGMWFSLIDTLYIDNDDNVVVVLGSVLKEEILNMRTIQIYDDVIMQLKNSVAKLIIFILQEKRIKIAIENQKKYGEQCKDKVLFFRTSYLFFTISLYYSKKNKKRFIQSIVDGLNELKEQNVLIDDFYVKEDYFYIYFKQFTEDELRIIAEEENPFTSVIIDYGKPKLIEEEENEKLIKEKNAELIEGSYKVID